MSNTKVPDERLLMRLLPWLECKSS